MGIGLLVGAAASFGLLVGFEPSRLPAVLLDAAAYKLTFLASLGLLAAGAVAARYARREERRAVEGRDERAKLGPADAVPRPPSRPAERVARDEE